MPVLRKLKRNQMNKMSLVKNLALGVACAALISTIAPIEAADSLPANAAYLQAYTGNTFALIPTADPNVLGHPVDGPAHVSLMGNCHFHGESEVHLPTSPDQPIVIVSTSPWSFTSADGKNSLKFDARRIPTFDPAN